MRITVNGEGKEFSAPLAVSALLAELGLEPRKIAVERNLAIVPKSLFEETLLFDGDQIEIVQFVGGG
ncbi:MAG: sulfur carrier protein ThiS [Pseudomonadota bacterium]